MMMQGDYIRRGAAEFVGAFALVFVGGGMVAFASTLTDVALANGLAIGVMVSAVGHISGGHFNPAITFGFWVTRRISSLLAGAYWIAQLSGATLAALLLKWVLPGVSISQRHLGAPAVSTSIGSGEALVVEAVLTFFLVWVVFASAADPRGSFKQIAGLAIGFTITLDVYLGFALTGGMMNPARAFGPQLVTNQWSDFWVWYVGPLAGGAIAALLYELLYLRPESPGSPESPEPGEASAF
jgi:aquaporin TIP